MKGYWCESCHGFVDINKKYLGAVVGNIILFPIIIIIALSGYPLLIPPKKECKRCGIKVKRRKMDKNDQILADEGEFNKAGFDKTGSDTPFYGIASIFCDLLGLMIIVFCFNSLTIFWAIPLLLIAIIIAAGGLDKDNSRGVAKLGMVLGIIFFIISLWPILMFGVFIMAGGW